MRWFFLGSRYVLIPAAWTVVLVDGKRYVRRHRSYGNRSDYWVGEDGTEWARSAQVE